MNNQKPIIKTKKTYNPKTKGYTTTTSFSYSSKNGNNPDIEQKFNEFLNNENFNSHFNSNIKNLINQFNNENNITTNEQDFDNNFNDVNQKSFDQITAQLEKMHELKEKGIISEEDFEKFKKSIL